MKPLTLGKKYDKIARWWQEQHQTSGYGVKQFQRALAFAPAKGNVLDVGCGAGGRFTNILVEKGYHVTGVDVSLEMVALAKHNHPEQTFVHDDICQWHVGHRYDFIFAWDSLFHLPLNSQKPVLDKLCRALKPGGVLLYTFGNAGPGAHTDTWHNDTFYYSSIGIEANIHLMLDNGLTLLHLELDQMPDNDKHAYLIAQNPD